MSQAASSSRKLARQQLSERPRRRLARRVVKELLGVRTTLVGVLVLLLLVFAALFANVITPHDPIEMRMQDRLQAPSLSHPFGTDEFGRDILSRVVHGTRISFKIAVVSVVVATVSGVSLGLLSGFLGGWFDFLSQRIIDIMLAFPGILLALAIMAALGPSINNAMIAVGIGSMPFFARLVRGSVLTLREAEFVSAARVIGAHERRILGRHILPNTLAPIIVLISQQVGWAILQAAALSFIGMGAQPPTPEWGAMLNDGRQFLHEEWWIATFPGIAIFLIVLGFNLFGDGLRDFLDPHMSSGR